MKDLLQDSVYFGVFISLGAYAIGMFLRRKTGYSFLNPLLISIILVIAVLLLTGAHSGHHLPCSSIVSAGGTLEEKLPGHPFRYCGRCLFEHAFRTVAGPVVQLQPCGLCHFPAQIHNDGHRYGRV